ncbi:MAG TPA: serine hydrolase domain-containing protein [Candidatus Sulfopaludibacter sp.]|jgi:CubicO group peptidase (beta-lactamase class C family)|nr:serine hydrolase domain-containing protein [Candidatus Sulfopaludibacter sp.]
MKRLIFALFGLASLVLAQPAASPERLARIDHLLQQYTDQKKIAGAVALVLKDGKPAYEHAFGWSDVEAKRKMTAGALFRIASQTKAFTSTAVLALYEEGKIGLDEPVSHFIPTFAHTTVAVRDDSGMKTVPARRAITIKDLLTHTAGISYGTEPLVRDAYAAKGLGPAAGFGWYTADKDEPICVSMERLGTLPFVSQPGEAFVYGYNTDILGCVVEKASGMPLDEFIRTRITGPLGLKDTRFYVPPAEKDRLATVYGTGPDGAIVRAPEGSKGQGHYVEGPRKSFAGGAGLTSTAHDYARFLEMIRNGGALDGVRILSPRTVALMTTNQSGTLHSTTGLGFGLGFETVDRYGASGMAGVGAFGWGGAYGTTYQVDPQSHLVIVLMIQMIPNGTDIQPKFSTAVYQALGN